LAEWVQKGYYLDLGEIPEDKRPTGEFRFAIVVRQKLTELEDLTVNLSANSEGVLDFTVGDLRDLLKPRKDMIIQAAYGFYPDAKSYLEHPVDYEQGKLPKETPSTRWRVGIIRQYDSPYEDPQLDVTEFWILPVEGYYTPKIHFKEIYGKNITVYIRLILNMLKIEPIKDPEVIRQLERRIRPSTPVSVTFY